MHPEIAISSTVSGAHTLCNLVFMMRKNQVLTAAMKIDQ